MFRWCDINFLFLLQHWKGGISKKKKSELPGYKLLSLTQSINCTPCWLQARYWIFLTCSEVTALMEGLAAICSRAPASLLKLLKFSCVGVVWVLTLSAYPVFRYFTGTQPKRGFNPNYSVEPLLPVAEVDWVQGCPIFRFTSLMSEVLENLKLCVTLTFGSVCGAPGNMPGAFWKQFACL